MPSFSPLSKLFRLFKWAITIGEFRYISALIAWQSVAFKSSTNRNSLNKEGKTFQHCGQMIFICTRERVGWRRGIFSQMKVKPYRKIQDISSPLVISFPGYKSMGLNLVLYTLGSFFKSKQMNKVMTSIDGNCGKKIIMANLVYNKYTCSLNGRLFFTSYFPFSNRKSSPVISGTFFRFFTRTGTRTKGRKTT